MTRSPLNPLHDGAQFPETRRGAMPGYSTPDLGRVTHGSGCGVPLKHHLGRGFGPGSFSPALPGKGLRRMQNDLNAAIRSLVIFVARASGNDTGDEAQ